MQLIHASEDEYMGEIFVDFFIDDIWYSRIEAKNEYIQRSGRVSDYQEYLKSNKQ